MSRTTSKPESVKYFAHLLVGDRIVGRQDRDPLDAAVGLQRGGAGVRADADVDARRLLDLGLERVGALGAAVERHRRHAHDQIVRRAGHHRTHGFERVLADHLRSRHERVVAHGLGIGRKNPAVVVGDAGRPHHLEIGLHDRVGRRPEHAELAPPAENVSHRRSCRDFRAAILLCLRRQRKVHLRCRLKTIASSLSAPARSA